MNLKKDKKLMELFLEQLRKNPILAVAAEKIGINRTTVHRWRKADLKFDQEVEDALAEGVNFTNDLVESVVLNAVKNNNIPAAALWLKHNSPKYSPRLELSGTLKTDKPLTPEQEELIQKALKMAGISASESDKETKE